jgi:hypothetical protein
LYYKLIFFSSFFCVCTSGLEEVTLAFIYLFFTVGIILHFVFFFIIYSYVYTLFGPSLPPVPQPLASRQNLFFPLLQFCWWENITDYMKDIAVLLVWDKDTKNLAELQRLELRIDYSESGIYRLYMESFYF